MIALQVAAALLALFMLVKHGPVLVRRPAGRPGAPGARLIAGLNVAIALLVLFAAVKALLAALI